MAGNKRYTCTGRYRDLRRCLKSLDSFTDGQARILDWDTEKLEFVRLQLTPKEGAYKGEKFNFEVTLSDGYPEAAPTVTCLSEIYHPNIDPREVSDNVCLNLFSEWENTFGLDDVVQGLLFLLYNPNQEDPLNGQFYPVDDENFDEEVQIQMGNLAVSTWDDDHKDTPLLTENKNVEEQLEVLENYVNEREKAGLIGDTVVEKEERELNEIGSTAPQDVEQRQEEIKDVDNPTRDIEAACPSATTNVTHTDPENIPLARNNSMFDGNLEREANNDAEGVGASDVVAGALPLDAVPTETGGEAVIRNNGLVHAEQEDNKRGSENLSTSLTHHQLPDAGPSESGENMLVLARGHPKAYDLPKLMECHSRNTGNADSSAGTTSLHSYVVSTQPEGMNRSCDLSDKDNCVVAFPLSRDATAAVTSGCDLLTVSRQTSKNGYEIAVDEDTPFDTNNNDNPEQYYKPFVEQEKRKLNCPEFEYILTFIGALCWKLCNCFRR